MADDTPLVMARQLLTILFNDRPRLLWIDNYIHGFHADPYVPDTATNEYKILVSRAVTNWMPLIVGTPAQALYVDNVRPGRDLDPYSKDLLPEWEHWQLSRLDSRQSAIYRAALGYGHSFTLTELRGGKIQTKGLSPLNTSAVFADPANDETPRAAFTITDWPSENNDSWGTASMWDDLYEYEVRFRSLGDTESVRVSRVATHKATSCPVTRFAAHVDLDGRTLGVVEPLITLQDRINQTVFDMLIIQTGGAFKVRTAAGMAPPYKTRYVENESGVMELQPVTDANGQPVMQDIQINAMKLLWAEDPTTKFGTLDETPLDGYLKAIEDAIRQLSAISQTPPHYLLGQIANLSAEALQAAETTLERKVAEFRQVFGESWERVFRLAAELNGIEGAIDDYKIEVGWRDMEARAMAKTADGLLKLRQLGAPLKGLLELVPGMTKTMLDDWAEYIEAEDSAAQLAAGLARNTATRTTASPATQVGIAQQDNVP